MEAATELQQDIEQFTGTGVAVDSALQLTIERADLLRALGHVQSVVERRNTIPVLANVKLEAKNGALSLTATDMDLTITENVDASIEREGAVTVPAHTLYDIIRKLPDGAQISLKGDKQPNGKLSIEAGNCDFALPCLPAAEFPAIDAGNMTHHFSLPAADVVALINKTRFAISTEETRYYLNGIYFHAAAGDDGETLRAVATDGHRLARMEVALPSGAEGMPGVIIPRKAVAELVKLLEENLGDVSLSISATKARFAAGKAVLLTKLIDGTFPDYTKVIPAGNDKVLEVSVKIFAQAVDRVSTISTEKSRGIKLILASGKITLTATSEGSGNAREEIEATYAADNIEIGFNSRYLLEMLSGLEGETGQFILADGNAPVVVRDTADIGALYVLMPMRV